MSARVLHYDSIAVRFDASTLRTNADGTKTVDGLAAHVGNMTYHDDQGRPFVEHVPASTLFDQRSLDSAAGTTLTIRHGPGLVTPATYRDETHGVWVKAWDAGNGHLGARVRLGSDEAIKFVTAAMDRDESVELSPTYEADVVDTPGDTEHGHHDAVQRHRDYSALALLGPDEARGGPNTKLKLDGPACAPKGARVQVTTTGRLDSAPRVALHSATGRSNMKQITLSSGGKSCKIKRAYLDGLRSMKLDAKADALETTEITWKSGDEEPGMMVIPTPMWEGMLESAGAGPVAAPAEELGEPLVEEQLEAQDADDDEKLDAKVARIVTAQLDARDAKRDRSDARRSSVQASASKLLPAIYDYSVGWAQTCLDAIVRVDPEAETSTSKLARDAAKGDPVAEGALRERLATYAAKVDSSANLTPGEKPDPKSDAAKVWMSPTMPTGAKQ